MKFSKLSKEKRTQLVLVVVVTVAIVCGLGLGLIRFQYANLGRLADSRATAALKLDRMRDAIKHADRLEADLGEARKTLAAAESDVASGDLYSWVINTLRRFKTPYKVDVPSFSPIGPVAEMNLLPGFPYKQVSLAVSGTAHFHDFGRFLADFENQFPHIRVVNLNLELDGTQQEPEMLSFRMDIVTLVKPNAS